MAKDPAMLWYWSDWNSGTVLMSRFLKGCYMDLLHAQFNHGHLSIEEVKAVLGGDFGQAWPSLQKKFSVDPQGSFFNERLDLEKIRRQKYVASRTNNKSGKKKSYEPTYDKHMKPHMENVNRNENENDFVFYTIEHCAVVALNDPRWVKASKADEKKLMDFNTFLESQSIYKMNPLEYKKYFANKEKKKDETHKRTSKSKGNSEGARQVIDSLKDLPNITGEHDYSR